jgi:acetyltransferase
MRPYPRELEQVVTLRDGRTVKLRPIRPDDAGALQRGFAQMTADDRHMRMFATMRELSDELAARFATIDYDRDMCLIAEDPDHPGELYGGARIAIANDGALAEYSVSIRSDQHGRGIGTLALQKMLEYARSRGVPRVWGIVHRENAGMRSLARRLGFREEHDPDDPTCVRTVKDL